MTSEKRVFSVKQLRLSDYQKGNILRHAARIIFRRIRWLRNFATVFWLKCIGCKVSWAAKIHPSATFELNGGAIEIGARTHIDRGVIIRAMGGRITIGADSSVNAYSLLSGGGGLEIADHVMIASHVAIYASNHVFIDPAVLMQSQGLSLQGVRIERDVWIGTGVRILDGVEIGSGSVLAAGAVVTRSTPRDTVSGGVPARVIALRQASTPIGDKM